MRFSTSELAAQLGAELVGPDVFVEGASIDSRTTRPGQLFVPIVAERDGHDFVRSALRAGAPAYLTSGGPAGATAIIVPDTAGALMHLGRVARGRVANGVVGITGSVGKTTTKDLLHQCLATSFRTAASERSFNNELGLPLTLLNAPDDVQWVVLEMGARDVGHITRLAEVARPDVGIVTGVAMAHVEYFGDLDGVARAKGELVQALPATGVAVLNVDDPRVAAMAAVSPCPVLGYAVTSAEADVRAGSVDLDGELRPRFLLTTPWGNGGGQPRSARGPAGPERAGRRRCGPVVRRALRRRRVGPFVGDRPPASHGGARRPERARPDRGLLQRQPGFDRGRAAFARCVRGRNDGWPSSGSWPSSVPRPRPSTGEPPVGRGARDRGRGLPDRALRGAPGRRPRRGRVVMLTAGSCATPRW